MNPGEHPWSAAIYRRFLSFWFWRRRAKNKSGGKAPQSKLKKSPRQRQSLALPRAIPAFVVLSSATLPGPRAGIRDLVSHP
jgi:hypothetical protein